MDDPGDPPAEPMALATSLGVADAAASKKKRGRRGGKGPASKTQDTASATQKQQSGVAERGDGAPSQDPGAVRERPSQHPDTSGDGQDEDADPSAPEAATKRRRKPRGGKGKEGDVSSISEVLQTKRGEAPRGKDALLAACLLEAALSGSLHDLEAALDEAKDPAKLEERLSGAWQELALLGLPLPFPLQELVVGRLMDLRFLLSARSPAQPTALLDAQCDAGDAQAATDSGSVAQGDHDESPAAGEADGGVAPVDHDESPAAGEAGGGAAPSHAGGSVGGPRAPGLKSATSAGRNAPAGSAPQTNKDKKRMMIAEKQVLNLLVRIEELIRYCAKDDGLDDQAMLLLHFVLQEMEVKHLMKSTYNVLPWEELEFLLVRCMGIHLGGRCNLIDKLILKKINLLYYLETFGARLKTVLDEWRTNDNNYPKKDRKVSVRELRKEWAMIYNDYDCLRDIDSLLIITSNLRVAQETNLNPTVQKNVLEYALQTTGEFLKNTWMCPRLSQETLDKICLIAPEYTGETLRKVRDKLAKLRAQSKDFSGSLRQIQSDLVKVERSLLKLLAEIEAKAVLSYCAREFQNGTKDAVPTIRSYLSLAQPSGVEEPNIDKQLAVWESLYAASEPDERQALENVRYAMVRDAVGPVEVYRQYRAMLENLSDSFSSNEASNVILALSISTKLKQLDRNVLRREVSLRQFEEYARVARSKTSVNLKLVSMFNASTAAGNIQATEDLNASYSADNLPKTDADRMAFVNTCIDSLRTVLSDPRAASAEFLVSSEGAPFMSAACRVLLDIATVWHEDTKPRAVTDVCSPVLFGRTLRNVLAHGNDMLESVPRYQPHLELALLAGRLVASDTGPAVDLLCGALQRPCHAHARDQLRGRLLRAVAAKCDLMSAARRGDVDAVREGLRQAPRLLEARDGAGRGLLHHAAASGSAELVRQLLEAGAPLGADRAGETPLHCAASKDVAGALLEHGERLGSASGPQANTDGVTVVSVQACDAADHLGRLPLHAAVASRRQGVMEYLLTVAKVDVDATDRSGCTALHLAVEHDDVGMVNALLEAGACSALDVDDAGGSPLHLAAAAAGPAVMSGLVGATVARTLSAFSELDPPQALEPGYVVGVLLAGRDGRSMTPLLRAAAHGNAASLRTLLDLSAPLTDATEDGQTALHLAARCGSAAVVDIIAELVAAAPDGQELARSLMAPDTSGYLPLHYAAEFGHLEVVKTLWSFPLGPWPVFDWISGSRTALHLAAMHGHDEVVAFLVERYAAASRGLPEGPHPPMCLAALYGHAGVLATLSGCGGADVVDADGYTPLHLAAEYGEEPSIEVLLAHGARRDVVDGVNNRTPLHLAALNGQVGAVRLLLGGACDDGPQGLDSPTLTTAPPHAMRTSLLEAEDYWGRTPLLLAVEHGAVLQELLEAGADWRHVDDRGETVLHRTARGHHNNVSKVLKFAKRRAPEQLKENVNRANESGRTPLDGAATAANADTIRLLVENGADVQIAPRTTSTLHIAVMSCHQAKSYDHVRTLLDLSPGYANVVFRHTRDPEPFPPLLCAVILGLKDVATLIAERCVDLHKEENCESLLILAKMKGIEGVVAILEDRGVRCPFPFDGSFGALPARPVQPGRVARPESGDAQVRDFAAQNLKEAIELQDMEELRFLLGRGGLPDTDLGGGMTALDLAFDVIPYSDEVMATIVEALTDEPGVCKPLLEARRLVPRGRNTLLELAVQRKCKRTVAALLRAGFPPEGTVGPCSLLTYALQWSRDIFHELLRYAARPPGQVLPDEVPDKNACGEILTAETFVGLPLVIHLASWGTTEQLKTLLDYGVSPNTRTSQTVQLFGRVCGDSPLLSAAKKGDVDKVKLLLARGADPLLPDQSGFTALQLAAVYGHPDVARVLVRHRPDLAADAMQGLPNAAQLAAVCADAEHKPGCREVLKVLCDASDDDMPALIEAAKEEARAILTEYSAGFEDQYIATMKSLSL